MHTNPLNKRKKIISLTDSGQAFAKDLILPLFQYEEDSASMLDANEMEAAIVVQNKFADILPRKVEQKIN